MKLFNRTDVKFFSVLTILFFSLSYSICAQNLPANTINRTLYFYGPNIDTSDDSKIQLSTDLFYSQFQAEGSFSLIDRRSTVFDIEILESHQGSDDVLFYNEIKEDDEKWYISLFLIDIPNKKEISIKHVYDEYYRVLIEAKDVLSELIGKYKSNESQDIEYAQTNAVQTESIAVSMANLFGTWQGEEFIDKIVILRGGKGFVIFDNGASMNISITVEGSSLVAKQDSKSNASFFPELPREIALVKALEVDPIEWELTIENENSLVGVKHTYTSLNENQGDIIEIEIPVKWYR